MSPVLDVAARLVLVRLKGDAELERREVVLLERRPAGMVQSLRELGVNVVICGALSRELLTALQQASVRVVPQVCGELDSVITAFRRGRLSQPGFAMPGCWRQMCGGGRRRRRRKCSRSAPARALAQPHEP